jgi:hypothetical protein
LAGLCQDCTGCCTVFEVKEVNSEMGVPCKHIGKTLAGSGCEIYLSRPEACQRYVCLWLDSQRRVEVPTLPEAMRPDVCKVVLGWPWGVDRETLHVYPYPGHETAWQKEPVRSYLRSIVAKGGKLVIVMGGKRLVIKGDVGFYGTEQEFEALAE